MTAKKTDVHKTNSLRYRTGIGINGETLYTAPIEIVDEADLNNYGIGREDCRMINFGGTDPRIVYIFMTSNRELAEEQWRYLNREHFSRITANRCLIPGDRKVLKRCHTANGCANCPYGMDATDKEMITFSWDQMTESAEKMIKGTAGRDLTSETGNFHILMEELQDELDRKDPRLIHIIRRKYLEGYSAREIATELDCSLPRIYQLMNQALKMAREFLKEEKQTGG